MTHRIQVTSQTYTTNVFSGHITDELTGSELITRTDIGKVTFRRYRIGRALVGTGVVEIPLDAAEVEIPDGEYQLYDNLQPGLDYSTDAQPFTFIWRIPESREPFFDGPGTFYVVFGFHPRDEGGIEKLTFEVTVT